MINLLAQAIYDGIYIIDCASFVLSVLPIIMNVAEDRCVSLCLEAWLFFAFRVGGPGASGGAVVLRSGADTARSPHQLRDASSPVPHRAEGAPDSCLCWLHNLQALHLLLGLASHCWHRASQVAQPRAAWQRG